ncbi:rRNA maturation RNase YbeY [Oecophyllibacter saccharovorans]|uniref:rRNA maturation RNase YbeY n=1 Tax=Oecophyllibacter saccharovorans TaxID=2558360 RepID=UPI001E65DA71|nr:rRNA maturation RNase YbeY [Oecophyllibacter saccharovorans]
MGVSRAHAEMPGGPAIEEGHPETPILVEAPGWRRQINDLEKLVNRTTAATLRHGRVVQTLSAGPAPTVTFSDDRRIRRLNGRFRGRHKPTNVLTFEPPAPFMGGDIILALETVQREAQGAGRPLRAHLSHLLVHGLLHLAGHDHHHPGEARRMETLETRIMRALGFADPWKQVNRRRP